MSRSARLLILAAVLVAAVVAFAALRPSDDDDPVAAGTTAPPATEPTGTATATTTEERTPEPTATPEPEPAQPAPVRIVVSGGSPVGGPKRIDVRTDQTVRITVAGDEADEVHLHGYDLERVVAPGKPAAFRFRARLEGIFELELHHSGEVVARLAVRP